MQVLSIKPIPGERELFKAKSFGVNVKPKCNKCKGCNECSYLTGEISHQELRELELIESKMTLNKVGKFWQVDYPFIRPPALLKNNYHQAHQMLKQLERRLRKSDLMETYNNKINKFIDRGVSR